MTGLITKGIGGFYYVLTEAGIIECKGRGIFKKDGITLAVGDEVEIELIEDEPGKGVINAILPRKNQFIRPPIVNVDTFIVVFAPKKPKPNYILIDKFLIMAEMHGIDPVICLNKCDLASDDEIAEIKEIYEKVYPVVPISCETGEGLDKLKEVVEGKTILITTSNGTKALTKSVGAKRIFVGCVLNGKSIAKKLAKINEDIIILNSGTNGEFTMDDFICTGYIIDEISKITNKIELTDISKTAQYIYEQNKDLEGFISKAKHYGRMKELDLMPDVEHAMKKDFTNLVPEYKDNHIIVE